MNSEQVEIDINDEDIRTYITLWLQNNLNSASMDQFHIILDDNNENFDKAVSSSILNQFIVEAVMSQIARMEESGELPKDVDSDNMINDDIMI